MADVISRTVFRGVNWQKQAGLLQQMMYFQSGNIALNTALVGRGKQFFPLTKWDFTFEQTNIRWIISVNISVKQPVTFT